MFDVWFIFEMEIEAIYLIFYESNVEWIRRQLENMSLYCMQQQSDDIVKWWMTLSTLLLALSVGGTSTL